MRTIKHILCPVDFTEKSEALVESAGFLARLYQADLTLVHVINSVAFQLGNIYGLGGVAEADWQNPWTEKAKEKARELLREYKKEYVPLSVTCKSSVRYGDVTEEIIKESVENNSDLLVLSTEGNDELRRSPLSSTISEIISRIESPVLVFHAIQEEKGFKRIMIPVDPTFGIQELVDYLGNYFATRDPYVELLTVVEPEVAEPNIRNIQDYLNKIVSHIRSLGIENVDSKIIFGKNPSAAINDHAVANNHQLIMMNTHGKSGIGGWSLGSVTHQVVSRSRIPVFTYRAVKIQDMQ